MVKNIFDYTNEFISTKLISIIEREVKVEQLAIDTIKYKIGDEAGKRAFMSVAKLPNEFGDETIVSGEIFVCTKKEFLDFVDSIKKHYEDKMRREMEQSASITGTGEMIEVDISKE